MFCLSIFHNLTPWTELVQPFFWLMVRKSMTFDLSRVCVCVQLCSYEFLFQCSAFFRNSSTGGPWALGWHGPMKTHPRCCENVPVCMHGFHCFHANTNLWQALFLPSLPVFQGHGRHGTIFTIWIAWWLSLQPPLPMFWWFSSTIWIFEFFLLFHWVSLA